VPTRADSEPAPGADEPSAADEPTARGSERGVSRHARHGRHARHEAEREPDEPEHDAPSAAASKAPDSPAVEPAKAPEPEPERSAAPSDGARAPGLSAPPLGSTAPRPGDKPAPARTPYITPSGRVVIPAPPL
jgi:hypothetical protein